MSTLMERDYPNGSWMGQLERFGRFVRDVGFPIVACAFLAAMLWQLAPAIDRLTAAVAGLAEGNKEQVEAIRGLRESVIIGNSLAEQGNQRLKMLTGEAPWPVDTRRDRERAR